MVKNEEKKKKSEIMREVLQEKSRPKKKWKKECINRGMSEKTFYYHFKNFKKRGEIKYSPEEKEWMLVGPKDKADHKEIKLYIDQIKNQNKNIRGLGADELIHLCKLKVVTHDSFLMRFFEMGFKDDSIKDVHTKLLDAFRYVLIRSLKDNGTDMVIDMLEKNKDSIKDFIKSGSLKLKSDAIFILRICPSKDVLDLLYEKILSSPKPEYEYLKEAIRECLKSHLTDYKVEIKRKLFEIATSKSSGVEISERAIDLLYDLSGLRNKILA